MRRPRRPGRDVPGGHPLGCTWGLRAIQPIDLFSSPQRAVSTAASLATSTFVSVMRTLRSRSARRPQGACVASQARPVADSVPALEYEEPGNKAAAAVESVVRAFDAGPLS